MCTASVLRAPWIDGDGGSDDLLWRLVFNRDERHARSDASPPRAARVGDVNVISPRDPDGGGTWLAASSAGLVFAVLNETECPSPPSGAPGILSRGLVIPALAACRSLAEAADRVTRLPGHRYRPFRLLVVSDRGLLEAWAHGGPVSVSYTPATPRLFRTSSSLAPARTRRLREALFDRMVPAASLAAQDAFHRHRWPGAAASSVLMSRPDARTVSVTIVDVFARVIRVAYRRCPAGSPAVTSLARAA